VRLPKSIADCLKYRNTLGVEVALEALKDAWSHRRARIADREDLSA
jgi:hypothetical protein